MSQGARVGAVLFVGVFVLSLVGPVASVAPPAPAVQDQPRADTTITRVQLFENGSARWTIRFRTRLPSGDAVADYEAFQSRFRNDTAGFLDPFATRISGVVANAGDVTGREMRATAFAASTSVQQVPRRWGVVTYEFTWTNFAATDGRALVVGDVFQGGFFIGANETLTLVAPPNYTVADVAPEPDERPAGTLVWEGRREFADERPHARFVPAEADGDTASGWLRPLVLAVLLVVVLGGYVLYRRRTEQSDDAPAPVVTDADRVRELLAERGGRMKQADIADALDWSASKTSRVLSNMAEDGAVEKRRIGRENVIDLTDDGDD